MISEKLLDMKIGAECLVKKKYFMDREKNYIIVQPESRKCIKCV